MSKFLTFGCLSFILLIFLLPKHLNAQEAKLSPTLANDVKFSDNPSDDFWSNLNSLITGNKIDSTLEKINRSALPLLPGKPVLRSSAVEVNIYDVRSDAGNITNNATANATAETMARTAQGYALGAGRQVPKDISNASTGLLEFLGSLLDKINIFKSGNEEAVKFAGTKLNQQVVKENIISENINSGGKSIAMDNNANGRVLGVGGFLESNAMPDALLLTQCADLPSSLCPLNKSQALLIPTPTRYPTTIPLIPTPTEGIVASVTPIGEIATPTPTNLVEATPTIDKAILGKCTVGTGYCSPFSEGPDDNFYMRKFFDSDEKALKASAICQWESGGNPFELNDGCLKGTSVDYSVGLFQINLLAHCDGAFSSYTWNPPSCTIGDMNKLIDCRERWFNPEENIKEAIRISGNGNDWSAWGAAKYCGIK